MMAVECREAGPVANRPDGPERMEFVPVNVKKVLIVVVVVLALFYVITNPDGAAGGVQTVLGWLRDGAEAIITFVKNLFA